MSLEDWDRPLLRCSDPTCPAVQRGVNHTTDESHREVLATLREMRTPGTAVYAEMMARYGNVELGRRPSRQSASPYLTPAYRAMLRAQEDKGKPHGLHWLWFFAAAILVIAPLEGWAIYLILQ